MDTLKGFCCRALFSALSGAQLCASKIHSDIKKGEQPFPTANSMSLKVSKSLCGLDKKKSFSYLEARLVEEKMHLRL